MARALGKEHLRLAAFDDGPFTRRHRWAPLAGVVCSTPDTLEVLRLERVRVDGMDATDAILRLWRTTGFREGPRAILLDGISYGGFNLVDLDRLHRRTGRPVVSLTARRPDYGAIEAALRKYFPRTFRERWRRVRSHPVFAVRVGPARRWAAAVGCRRVDAARLIARSTMRGAWPEPLRLARLLARAARAVSSQSL
ncbi:MAG TPA: DUF99 family protein [Thermoplasmata archaeon]|nr:DUF99 family protein [Thermoplasmata archaeon]